MMLWHLAEHSVNFDYTLLEVESYDPDFSKDYIKEIRHFWDGGMLNPILH